MVGKALGPYKILEQLGAGGMGEVYLAEDSRLGRKVAIKVLPAQFAADEERLARFEQEARAAAALNHPNIAVVHDIGAEAADDGVVTHFIVQEYLEGQSLGERVEANPLPADDALRIATGMADGLAAAHAAGVVHRDLKPDNVFVTREGHVKMLDFGLAKLRESDADGGSGSLSMSPTSLGTVAGQLMGTAAYMSPEQARGETVDSRTDIWAFGVVLYEMLSGERLFKADSISDTMAAVLRDDVDLDKLPDDTPHDIRRLLGRCLERDTRRRLHHIADARIEIEDALSSGPVDAATSGPSSAASSTDATAAARTVTIARPLWQRGIAGAGLVAVGMLLGTWVLWNLEQTPSGSSVMRLPVQVSRGVVLDTGIGRAVTIAPDGSKLAYVAAGRLFVRFLDQLEPRELAANAGMPFFSPDGEWVGFFTGRELRKVSVNGGTPLTIATVREPRGGAWVGDTIVYAPDTVEGLWAISASGTGEPRELTTADAGERSHRWPSPLPDGDRVLYAVQFLGRTYGEGSIRVLSLSDGTSQEVHRGGAFPTYAASGHLLFMQESTLFAAPLDEVSLALTGSPVPVVEEILAQSGGEQIDSGSAQFDVADNGTLVYFADRGLASELSLIYVDMDGRRRPVGLEPGAYQSPRFSSDGRLLTLHVGNEIGSDIWTIDLERGTRNRITSLVNSVMPVFSPDGANIAYGSTGEARASADIYFGPVADPSAHTQLTNVENITLPGSFSPDGTQLSYAQVDQERGYDVGILDIESGIMTPLVATAAREQSPDFSPDGRWIAYDSDETGRSEVYVVATDGTGRGRQVSTEGGIFPRWASDGGDLYWRNTNQMMAAAIDISAEGFVSDPPRELFVGGYLGVSDYSSYDVNPNGEGFVMLGAGGDSGIDGTTVSEHVTMVFDFFSILREATRSR